MEKTNLFNRLLKSLSEEKGFVAPGSGGVIYLTPYLSLIVAILYMMAADDEISDQECNQLLSVFGDDQQILQRALKYVESKSVDEFLAEMPEVVEGENRLCILLNVCDSSMSDGDFSKSEMILFSRMLTSLGYEKNSFKPYFDTIALKNKHSVFGDSAGSEGDQMPPTRALVVAMLYMMSVDGEMAKEEIGQITVALRGSKDVLPEALKYVKRTKFPDFMNEVGPVLNHQQKLCILVNVADCMLSDGRVDRLEQDLFRRILTGFGISEASFKKHFSNLTIKNDRPVDIRKASKSKNEGTVIRNTINTDDTRQFADAGSDAVDETIMALPASAPASKMASEIGNKLDKNAESFVSQANTAGGMEMMAANARAPANERTSNEVASPATKASLESAKNKTKKSAKSSAAARAASPSADGPKDQREQQLPDAQGMSDLRNLRDAEDGESDTRRLRDGQGTSDLRNLRDAEGGESDTRRLRGAEGDSDLRSSRDAEGESDLRRLRGAEGEADRRQLADGEGDDDKRQIRNAQAKKEKRHLRDTEGESDLRKTSDGDGELDFRTAKDASAGPKSRHLRDATSGGGKKINDSDSDSDAIASHDNHGAYDPESHLHVRMDYLKSWTGSLKDNLDEFESIDARHTDKRATALELVTIRPDRPAVLTLALALQKSAIPTNPQAIKTGLATVPWVENLAMTEKNQQIATDSATPPVVDKTRKVLAALTTGLIITQGFSSFGLSEAQNTFMTNQLMASTTHMSVQTLTVQQGAFNLTAELLDHIVSKNEGYSSDLRELSKTSAETYRAESQKIESGTAVSEGKPSLNEKIKLYENQSAIQLLKLKWFGLANGILMMGFFMSFFGLFFKSKMSVTGSSIVFILGTMVTLNGFYLII